MEEKVEDFEICRKICNLLQKWKFNKVQQLLHCYGNREKQTCLLKTPFFHHKHGSLQNLTNLSMLIWDDGIDNLLDTIRKLKYWGFDDLAESIVQEKVVRGYSDEAIISKLKQNGNPHDIMKQFTIKIDLSLITPQGNSEIMTLVSNYKTFRMLVEDKKWKKVSSFVKENPTLLLTPYFWSVIDDKSAPMDLVFRHNAPIEIIRLLTDIGGRRVVDGAYNEMHKTYPLHRACFMKQSLDVIRHIVDVAGKEILYSVDATGDPFGTPLQIALYFNAPHEVIKYLVDMGGCKVLNMRSKSSETPLMTACKKNLPTEIIQCMLAIEGEDIIQTIDCNWETPLHHACKASNLEVVKCLVDKGGVDSVLATTKKFQTPLHNALMKEKFDIAEYLCDISVSSVFHVGRNRCGSFLCHYLTGGYNNSDGVISFILDRCPVEDIVYHIFGTFVFHSMDEEEIVLTDRVIDSIARRKGKGNAWEQVLPFLYLSNMRNAPILHSVIKLLHKEPIMVDIAEPLEATYFDILYGVSIMQQQTIQHDFDWVDDNLVDGRGRSDLDYGNYQESTLLCFEKVDIIKDIMMLFPNSALIEDENDHRLPLHTASALGYKWIDMLPIIEGNCGALEVVDPVTGLYPFALAAACSSCISRCCSDYNDTNENGLVGDDDDDDEDMQGCEICVCDLNTIYQLIQKNPQKLVVIRNNLVEEQMILKDDSSITSNHAARDNSHRHK
jgi:ankyrin repeat protein